MVNQTVDHLVKQATNQSVSHWVRPTTQSLIHNYNNDDDNNKPIYLAQNVSEGIILSAYTPTYIGTRTHKCTHYAQVTTRDNTQIPTRASTHTLHVTTPDNTQAPAHTNTPYTSYNRWQTGIHTHTYTHSTQVTTDNWYPHTQVHTLYRSYNYR